MDFQAARVRILFGLLLLSSCGDESPGEELPDEGNFTTNATTFSWSTTMMGATTDEDPTAGTTTVSPGTTSTTTATTSTTVDGTTETVDTDPETEGTSSETTVDPESTSTTAAGTTTTTTTTTSDPSTETTPAESSSDTGASSTGIVDPGPGCADGLAEAGEVCFEAEPESYTLGDAVNPVDIVEGDFDDDGEMDVATANADGTVTVLFGTGDGELSVPSGPFAVGDNPVRIRSADLDGNGSTDLVVLNRGDGVTPGSFTVLLADGSGGFDATSYDVGLLPSDMEIGVLDSVNPNAPEPPDIVVANEGDSTISTALNNGDGTFADPVALVPQPQDPAPNPLNFPVPFLGIGVGSYGGSPANDILSIGAAQWIANEGGGNGGFGGQSRGQVFANGALHRADSADFNGDGGGDAVVINGTTQVIVMPVNPGQAQFTPSVLTVAGASEAIFGDAVGSEDLDVIVSSETTGTVSVFAGDGTTIATTATSIDVGTAPTGVAVADLNGDGVGDIIVCNDNAGAADDAVTVVLSNP